MTLVLALVIALAIGLPHFVRLGSATPTVGATIWLSSLVLRALAVMFALVFVVFFLPGTEAFALVTQWCWHAVLPFFAAHLGFGGHQLGDAATVAPAFLVAISLLSVLWALRRAGRAVARLISRDTLEGGPAGSVIVSGPDVLVAAAGIANPTIIVSTGALTALDDEELAASLDHERGHIARRHRYFLVTAEVCRAVARFVPGTKHAAAALAFHLERDADEYAVARRHDPLALASAICKAGGVRSFAPAAMALSGDHGAATRVRLLAGDGRPARSARATRLLALTLSALTLVLFSALPAFAIDGAAHLGAVADLAGCPA